MTIKKDLIFIFKIVLLCLAGAILFAAATSCNPQKQATKLANKAINNPVSYQKVGRSYILQYGCISDTVKVVYKKGKDSTITTFKHDTVTTKVPCDSFVAKTKSGSTVRVNKGGILYVDGEGNSSTVRIDTANYTLVDKTQINICADSLAWYRHAHDVDLKNVQVANAEKKEAQAKLNWANAKFWIVIGVLALLIGLAVFLKVKGKLPL